MIRNLLATTAVTMLLAGPALAQQQPADPAQPQTMQPAAPAEQPTAPVVKADGYLASNIIGETVYDGNGDNAQNIGDINDVVLDKDGKAQQVVIGVGGFLGVGERNVAVEFAKMSWAEKNGDRWLVYPSTKDQLAALPEFDRRPYDPAPASDATSAIGTEPAPATTEPAPAAPSTSQ